jgi:hypothetical protein
LREKDYQVVKALLVCGEILQQKLLQFLNPFREELEDYQNQILNYLLNNLNDNTFKKVLNSYFDVNHEEDIKNKGLNLANI